MSCLPQNTNPIPARTPGPKPLSPRPQTPPEQALAPPRNQSFEQVTARLTKTSRGEVQSTIQNCVTALQYDPLFAGGIQYNLLTERVDLTRPMAWSRQGTTLTDMDFKYILRRMEQYGLSAEKKVDAALTIVANENRYHPIRDFLNRLTWDGEPRIRHALHHFLGAAEDDYTEEALRLFLMGAIHRVFRPGCKFEVMLCLVGGQGAGKSSFFRLLAMQDAWFTDDLKRLDDENLFRKLQGHWIIELSEMLATTSARNTEEIKSFLSRQKETYKVPYETHPADRLRQCVFAGTTNRQDFLPQDRTGNRRFLPVLVDAAQAEVHILADEAQSREYLAQLWAEAMELYRSGDFRLTFSPALAAHLTDAQQAFLQEDTLAGTIGAFLETYPGTQVCSRLLWAEALGQHTLPTLRESRAIGEVMNTGIANGSIRGWEAYPSTRRYQVYGAQKGWERISQTETNSETDTDDFIELTDEELDLPF